jgi:cytochrome bd-type quinol oxidase subunit 2
MSPLLTTIVLICVVLSAGYIALVHLIWLLKKVSEVHHQGLAVFLRTAIIATGLLIVVYGVYEVHKLVEVLSSNTNHQQKDFKEPPAMGSGSRGQTPAGI